MIGLASGYSDTPTAQNATFQPPITSDFRQEFLRLDYIFNPKHSIFGRYVHDKNGVVEPYGTFINSPIPTSQQFRNRPGNGFQVGHLWNVKASVINEMNINASWTDQRMVPSTDYGQEKHTGMLSRSFFRMAGSMKTLFPTRLLREPELLPTIPA